MGETSQSLDIKKKIIGAAARILPFLQMIRPGLGANELILNLESSPKSRSDLVCVNMFRKSVIPLSPSASSTVSSSAPSLLRPGPRPRATGEGDVHFLTKIAACPESFSQWDTHVGGVMEAVFGIERQSLPAGMMYDLVEAFLVAENGKGRSSIGASAPLEVR